MKTDALYVKGPSQIEIRSVSLPSPKYDELQIQTTAVGICAGDSHLYTGKLSMGPFPYRIGHEAVGIVVDIGDGVEGFEKGDKVGLSTGCDEMMARHFNVKCDGVAKIPNEETDYAKWVLEPAACVVNLLNEANIQPGDSVVLIGAGYMGLLALQGLMRGSQAGEVTVFEINNDRLAIAKEYDPDYCFSPLSDEGKAHLEAIKAQGGADIVIEFAAAKQSFEMACELAANSYGKLVLGSWIMQELTFDPARWHRAGLNVLNLSPSSNTRFCDLTPRVVTLIKKGVYDTKRLVTHTASFGDIPAMDEIFIKSNDKSDGYIKGVILFD